MTDLLLVISASAHRLRVNHVWSDGKERLHQFLEICYTKSRLLRKDMTLCDRFHRSENNDIPYILEKGRFPGFFTAEIDNRLTNSTTQ